MNLLTHIIILQILLSQVLSNILNCVSSKCGPCKYPEKYIMQVECSDSYTVKAKFTQDYNPLITIIVECHSDKIMHWEKHFDLIDEYFYRDFYYINLRFSKCQLSGTKIEQIISILGIKNIRVLELLETKINGTLESTYFASLKSVLTVEISKTILILTNHSFNGTPILSYLSLKNNDLKEIPQGVFKHLFKLLKLDLSNNCITKIESDVFEIPSLIFLDLSNNYLTTLSLNIPSLILLNLMNNSFTHLKPEALNLPELETLYLAKNNIRNLTSNNLFSFHNLVNVTNIDLSYNFINCIDPGWLNLTNLIYLDLSSNNFTVLKLQEFQNINGIRDININFNPLEEINMSGLEEIAKAHLQPKSSYSQLHISSGKLICDCRNYELARFIRNQSLPIVQKYLKINEKLICNDGTVFSKIKIDSLTCDWKMFEDLDKTDCLRECECTYRPHDKSALMNCSKRNLTLAPKSITSSRNLNYTELNLSHNSITKLPNYQFFNIKKLYIEFNNLNSIIISQLPKNLMELRLESNNLSTIDESNDLNNTLSNIRILTINSNPWICDCDAKDTLNFIHKYSSKITDLLDTTCYQSPIKLHTLTVQKVCEPKTNGTSIAVFMTLAVLGLVLFIGLLGIMYTNHNVKVWLYSRNIKCLISEESQDQDKIYDAFLSYSHKDQDLVANHLLPGLEEGSPSFRVCIHERDWVVGEFIPDQIVRSVECSRRTIIVLSKHFVDSVWGRIEFMTAMANVLKERRNQIIVIRYGDLSVNDLDLELRTYLSMNTYIQWGDSRFWDRLRYALRSRPDKNTKTKNIVTDELYSFPLI